MDPKSVHVARPPQTYDAIVVGSGIAGGWAAKELCEHGLRTLVLERGRNVAHGTDYVTEHEPPWQLPHRGRLDPRLLEKDYFIQRRTGFVDETNLHFFFRDSESPYIEEQPFTWVRGHQVGGRSLTWGRYCFRISDLDFEANLREGIGADWPIRYADIAPWYTHVEQSAGISGEPLGLPHLPDGAFQQPIPLNVVELDLRRRLEALYPERRLTIARAAVLTEPLPGRLPCHYCGPCWRGCSTGSYFSSQSSTLPAAVATGNLTLRPMSVVESILYDETEDRAVGVRIVDAETRETREYHARLVFLCASALGSTHVLLNSRSPRFPDGLGSSSGELGHNLMDHHFKVGAVGTVEGFRDRYTYGNRPVGFYIPRYRNISQATRMDTFVRGYGIEGEAYRPSWGRGTEMPGFGADLKARLREPGPWQVWMTGFGETLPRHENHVRLDAVKVDAFGIPQLRINCAWGNNELAMREDMATSMAEMLERCGLTDVHPYDDYAAGGIGAEPGLGIHEMGTARMGRDPKTSVLNAFNQVWDAPNVFVTDGACMPSGPCQNPSITYMALTARAVDHAVAEAKRGNL
ncbi:MAG: GMC family oxidoreductase [Gemmatimonadota bacterium]|nr:GMC family oxidoreductase [Gemmatimonadota bacterium]MDH5196061.1 GMC family oxidoreductase [Gemmatimonadota bacterium]